MARSILNLLVCLQLASIAIAANCNGVIGVLNLLKASTKADKFCSTLLNIRVGIFCSRLIH